LQDAPLTTTRKDKGGQNNDMGKPPHEFTNTRNSAKDKASGKWKLFRRNNDEILSPLMGRWQLEETKRFKTLLSATPEILQRRGC
jgi:hypothetical protein